MARRMFSDDVTCSDAFLDMPSGSQLLYFHLGMAADDDGFIGSPKMIMRTIGSNDDEYKILVAKKFVIHFEKGICVIKHWRINNYLRKDIYKETRYIKEKKALFIRKNGSYSLNPENAIPVPEGHFVVKDTEPTQYVDAPSTSRALSIGKVRIGKDSEDKVNTLFETFWENFPPRRKSEKSKCLKKFSMFDTSLQETITKDVILRSKEHVDWLKQGGEFVPAPIVYLNKQQWETPIIKTKNNTGKIYG